MIPPRQSDESPENRSLSNSLRRSLALLALLVAVYGLTVGYRSFSAPDPDTSIGRFSTLADVLGAAQPGEGSHNPTVPIERSPFRFTEIAQPAGIRFVHVSGMTEVKHFPTAYGSGVAMFDFDNDGKLDLYFATATQLPPGTAPSGPNRLYRNLGKARFEDVTEHSGLGFAGYCQGLVVGDIDNDGDQDLFLCNYGRNVLYRNNGDGTFRDISEPAGIDRTDGWSTAGAFLDYDQDGDLDLYVTRFGHWKVPDDVRFCGGPKAPGKPGPEQAHVYCAPQSIRPARHILYRNNGDRTFTDVTGPAGVGRTDGRGLGVVAADLNDDGRIDLYVANDTCPNFVFLNRGDGTFADVTDTSGAGYDTEGRVRAGMGVDAEDVNGDGLPDLFVTNYWNEPNALFVNCGGGRFAEQTRSRGMMHDSLPWVGWGCVLADFDNDGWPDCFVANGHVNDNLDRFDIDTPYAEPALLHRNRNGTRFELATRDAGAYFDSDHVGRGVAYGDIDDDGDIDLVVNHMDGPPALLRNDTSTRHHWTRLRLVGTRSNRDGVGAKVEIVAGRRTIVRQRKGGSSYASAHDPRLLIGLGDAPRVERLTVRWPSGQVDQYLDIPAGADLLLSEGAHQPEVRPVTASKDAEIPPMRGGPW